jgi:hypothetical protein
VTQVIARKAAVRRSRVRISARHPGGGPLPERTAMKKLEQNSGNVMNECVWMYVMKKKLIKSSFVPPNLLVILYQPARLELILKGLAQIWMLETNLSQLSSLSSVNGLKSPGCQVI